MNQNHSSLGEKLSKALTPLFDHSPTFVSDYNLVVEQLKSMHCLAFEFKEVESLPHKLRKNVVMVAMDNTTIPPYTKLHALFRNSRVLMIPLVSFDPSIDATCYALELIAQSDFESATKLNRTWLARLMEPEKPWHLRGNSCDLTCEIEEGVYVMRPKTDVLLLPGEWDSIGSYFEVGMVPPPDSFRPAFVINGKLSVPGVAVAHHRQMTDSLLSLPSQAWSLFENLRNDNGFPLKLEIVNSQIVQILAGGVDILENLAKLTNEERELILTEMAFSTNISITTEKIDWTKNSQMNEGLEGIHLAVGDGLTGAHVDFICPEVDLIA